MTIDAKANLRTVRDALRFAVTRFNEADLAFGHGQVDAFDEASFLVMRALSLPLERMDIFLDAFLTMGEINSLLQLIERRIKSRMPAAYLLNECWLQGYRFYVDTRCIIPRSFIAELLKNELQPWIPDPNSVRRVLDLCTGSGCLAIMAANVFPDAEVDAIDVSLDALAVATRNIEEYGLRTRVRLLSSNLFEAVEGRLYDLILCNPPYVTDASMDQLPPEYQHEPRVALAGGADGMDLVRRIVREAHSQLEPGGTLVLEIGDGRSAIERSFPELPLTWLTTSAGDDVVFLAHREDLPA
ncbi:50S ribosomal protein L3 glutamine methyltransferase [Burkholderiales bacterium]|nr:50S ribosomal protein L3 glutamine methyltransferase [Burkholderiales bacterium]